jgi:hypothetical protein
MQTDGSTRQHSTDMGNIPVQDPKFFRMHTYEKRACKSPGMRTYETIALKAPWNEYLQKKADGGGRVSRKSAQHLGFGHRALGGNQCATLKGSEAGAPGRRNKLGGGR